MRENRKTSWCWCGGGVCVCVLGYGVKWGVGWWLLGMLCHKGPTFTMSPFTMFSHTIKGSSINIVTALLEWGQGFSDDITKALLIKTWQWGKWFKNCYKMRDVIYGRVLSVTNKMYVKVLMKPKWTVKKERKISNGKPALPITLMWDNKGYEKKD